jgi:hypothetical protein
MNGRLFDPLVGRFMQAASSIGDAADLQDFDRYTYCANNPLTCTDPSGLRSIRPMRSASAMRAFAREGAMTQVGSFISTASSDFAFNVAARPVIILRVTQSTAGMTLDQMMEANRALIEAGSHRKFEDVLADMHRAIDAAPTMSLEDEWYMSQAPSVGLIYGTDAMWRDQDQAKLDRWIDQNPAFVPMVKVFMQASADRQSGAWHDAPELVAASSEFNWAHVVELAVYGKEAHDLLQDYANEHGYVTESKCATPANCVDGRFDIADRNTKEVWEIKRNSFTGLALGEVALEAYTSPQTGLQRGGDLVGLRVGTDLSLWNGDIEYEFTNYGGGLIGYSRYDRTPQQPIRIYVPKWGPVPGGARGRDDELGQ